MGHSLGLGHHQLGDLGNDLWPQSLSFLVCEMVGLFLMALESQTTLACIVTRGSRHHPAGQRSLEYLTNYQPGLGGLRGISDGPLPCPSSHCSGALLTNTGTPGPAVEPGMG